MSQLIKLIWIVKCPECDLNITVGDIDKAEILHREHTRKTNHAVNLYPEVENDQ